MKIKLILLLSILSSFFLINLYSIEQIGPAGISANLLSVDAITNKIYVVSKNNNIYKVAQETNSWTQLIIAFQNGEKVNSIAANNNVVFIGTNYHIYRSLNGGLNWSIADNGITFISLANIVIYKPNPNIIFTQVDMNEWYRSTNNGNTWQYMGVFGAQRMSYNPDSDFVLLINSGVMYKSYDCGASWNEEEYSPISDMILSSVVINDSTYIVGGFDPNDITKRIFITHDYGNNWENITYGFDFNFPTDLKKIGDDIFLNVATFESESELRGVFKLDRINHTWVRLGDSFAKENNGIYIDNFGNNLVSLSMFNGLFIFNLDENTTCNLTPNNIYELSLNLCSDSNLLNTNNFCRSNSLYSFSNNQWHRVDSLYTVFEMAQSPFDPNFCVGLSVRKGVYLSQNNGDTWIQSNNGIAPNDRQLINNVHFLTENIILISGYEKNLNHFNNKSFIYRSINRGETWVKTMEVDSDSVTNGISLEDIVKVGDTFYACMHCGIKKSEDFGLTWEDAFNLNNREFMQLQYDSDSETFYLRTVNLNFSPSKSELIKTTDFVNWTDCFQSFSDDYGIIDFELSPFSSGTIFCSTYQRDHSLSPQLIFSRDFGQTWNEIYFDEINSKFILDIGFINATDDIIICPENSSIYKFNLNDVLTTDFHITPINDYALKNYPNPFSLSGSGRNSSTTISFDLPKESEVNLAIYNIKGQKVKNLTNEKYQKGKHSLIWNGKNESNEKVGSGVYFYKLSVDGKTENVKKCLLLK